MDQTGKYAVKIYTVDGVMIYQAENGSDNTGKSPLGGVIAPNTLASSMLSTIANPITFYGDVVINQEGHSGDLYNYYWTSYSRGTDGMGYPIYNLSWHNVYLDGYIPLRAKSIYDPCPYLYRIPSNGTYNQFNMQTGWTNYSYLAGASWNMNTLGENWFSGLGRRSSSYATFDNIGGYGFYQSSTVINKTNGYAFFFDSATTVWPNRDNQVRSTGFSVRCIDFAALGLRFNCR